MFREREGNTEGRVIASGPRSTESKNLSMHGTLLRENREAPCAALAWRGGRSRKAKG